MDGLLDTSPWPVLEEYYARVTLDAGLAQAVRVGMTAKSGKGLFTRRRVVQGEVVFKERMLAGMQHRRNRAHALVCSQCLRFVGSVELQIARQLPLDDLEGLEEGREGAPSHSEGTTGEGEGEEEEEEEEEQEDEEGEESGGEEDARAEGDERDGEGERQEQGRRKKAKREEDEEEDKKEGDGDKDTAQRALGKAPCNEGTETQLSELLVRFLSGQLVLPGTEKFPLPHPIDCTGGSGCAEVFCSTQCMQGAWDTWHSLLCTGERSRARDVGALHEFLHHADETNDIFFLAAKVLSTIALAAQALARRSPQGGAARGGGGSSSAAEAPQEASGQAEGELRGERPENSSEIEPYVEGPRRAGQVASEAGAPEGASAAGEEGSEAAASDGAVTAGQAVSEADASERAVTAELLQRASLPFAAAHKAIWWEAVACPPDVPQSEEGTFRESIHSSAEQSLSLLRRAIGAPCFEQLFTIHVYGSIIGAFELNNLEVVVPSPVQQYSLLIQEEYGRHSSNCGVHEVLALLRDVEGVVGKSWCQPCRGTALYSLQSCINHSCTPNARALKGKEDVDGSAVVVATRDIADGEELSISYIDETTSLSSRTAALADYGFVCTCGACLEERDLAA